MDLRSKFITFTKIIVSLLLILYLFHKIGVNTILQEISSAKLSWIFFGIFIFTISNLLGSFQWYLFLKNAGVQLGYLSVVRYYYIGLFFNNFFISNMGGDFFRFFYISRQNKNSSAAISTVFLDRFLGFTMLTVLAVIAGIYWFSTFGFSKIWPALLILMACWSFLILVLFNRKLGHFFGFLLKWFTPEKILIKLRDIYNLIYEFSKNRRLVIFVFFISLSIQFIRVMIHIVAGKAIGVEAHFISFLIFIPLIALLSSLPISIGGLGIREQTGVLLFKRVGVAGALSASMEFLAYLLTIISSLPGIVFFILADKRRKSEQKA